jgi:hypothetical protein
MFRARIAVVAVLGHLAAALSNRGRVLALELVAIIVGARVAVIAAAARPAAAVIAALLAIAVLQAEHAQPVQARVGGLHVAVVALTARSAAPIFPALLAVALRHTRAHADDALLRVYTLAALAAASVVAAHLPPTIRDTRRLVRDLVSRLSLDVQGGIGGKVRVDVRLGVLP